MMGDESDSRFQIEDLDGIYKLKEHSIDLTDIAPGNAMADPRKHLPNCTVCWGCKHTLEYMASGAIMFNNYYSLEIGGSPSWLFRVRTNKTASGWAVVKTCPKLWIEPINGIVPGHGFPITWLGLWADAAAGVSIQNLIEGGSPRTKPEEFLEMMSRVDGDEVKRGAIHDLLFSQCDRHQQNLLFQESGKMTLIDNDQVYGTAWRRCGVDSILIPTTQKFQINHLQWAFVMKNPPLDPPQDYEKSTNPLQLLDYRCHVKDGKIGTDFQPKIQACLTKISGMSTEKVMSEYGYPHILLADAIRNRSRDMLSHGYEWTLYHGEPLNQPMHRYKESPPCCSIHYNTSNTVFGSHVYICNDPAYHKVADLPFGNAWHGGEWQGRPGEDTGNYNGSFVQYPVPLT
eukprot:gene18764-25296_t